MALVTPDAGELLLLDWMLKQTSVSNNFILKLFQSNTTPSQSTVSADFTEANFTNYTNKTLTRASWAAPTTVSNKANTTNATQSWTCGASGNTVYGYWVEDSGTATCVWAERFATSRVLASGDVLNIQPTFTLNSES